MITVDLLFRVALSSKITIDPAKIMNSSSNMYEGKSTKFAIMVGNVTHFKAAVLTADQMQQSSQKFTIEIIAVGEVVKDIADDQTLLENIRKTEALGVKLVVCEIAMASHKVSKKKLDPRITTIRNGWIHMFELKDKGYNTLST